MLWLMIKKDIIINHKLSIKFIFYISLLNFFGNACLFRAVNFWKERYLNTKFLSKIVDYETNDKNNFLQILPTKEI